MSGFRFQVFVLLILFSGDAYASSYQKIEVFDGRVVLQIPAGLEGKFDVPEKQQHGDEAKIPAFIYQDSTKQYKLRFEHIGVRSDDKRLEKYVTTYTQIFKNNIPYAKFSAPEVREIGGNKIGIIEFIRKEQEMLYTLLFYITIDGQLAMGSFDYRGSEVEMAKKQAHQMISSIEVKAE